MSATIVLPDRIHSPGPFHRGPATPLPVGHASGPAARLRAALRRVGAAAIAALGLLAKLGWAFFGSLRLGLGASGAADAATAWLWLAGEVCIVSVAGAVGLWFAEIAAIAGIAALAVLVAAGDDPGRDEDRR